MRAFWILVPVMMLALTIPATTSACPGCGKDKSAEGAPVFGAEQGGCPHAQKAVEAGECPCAKAAAAKAEGAKVEGLKDDSEGACENCPMHKDGAGACPHMKDGKGCGCGGKDAKACGGDAKGHEGCDCKDCPHRMDQPEATPASAKDCASIHSPAPACSGGHKDGTCPHQKGARDKAGTPPPSPAPKD